MGAKGAKDESEPTARLAAILGSTEDAVIGKTLYGTITSWDAGASAIYGYAPEEIIGRSMSELIPPDRPGELIAILERVARGERVDPFETRRVRKDGTLIDVSVSVSPILDETGTVVGATSVARDISARLRAAADRMAIERRLAAIVESSQDAIVGKTLDGTITTWNSGASAMYGYAPEEMIGRNISELIPPDRRGELITILDRLGRGQRVDPFETRRVRKDGTLIDVSVSVSPILDETGTLAGAASVARDISARLRAAAEQQVLEARLRQSERMETLGQLAGGIAHDFNNLLGIIVGCAGLLADDAAGNVELLTDVRRIEDAAQRAAALTRQLLIFGQRDLTQPEDVQLNDVITAVRELLSASLGGGVDLRFDPGARLPAITIDRGHVEQVLLNLVFNARDAMPGGGTVAVATRVAELDQRYCVKHPDATRAVTWS